MRLRFVPVVMIVAALGLAACSAPAPSQEFGKADVDQIKAMVQDFVTAYNARDLEKVGSFFSASAALMPANRSTLRGVDTVKGYYEGRWKEDGTTNLSIVPETVDGHGPLGFFAGTFSLELKGPDGAVTGHDRGKVIWIVHKYAGGWKFDWQMMSSDLPPVVPAPAPDAKPAAK